MLLGIIQKVSGYANVQQSALTSETYSFVKWNFLICSWFSTIWIKKILSNGGLGLNFFVLVLHHKKNAELLAHASSGKTPNPILFLVVINCHHFLAEESPSVCEWENGTVHGMGFGSSNKGSKVLCNYMSFIILKFELLTVLSFLDFRLCL